MPRNGSGVYTLPAGNPVVTGTVISSTTQNNTMADVAAELTNSLAADGQKTPTANLPMGGFRHTGVLNANARDQYAAVGQVQDGSFIWCGTAAGTANALEFSPIPAITAYAVGQSFRFKALSNNSGATTIQISGIATPIALQVSGVACSGGEVLADQIYEVFIDTLTTAQLRDVSKTVNKTNKIFSISAAVASNILTSTLNPVAIDFRSATLGSGVINTRTVSTAITVAVPDTATLGTTSATLSRLILLAIDNAGTVELAIGNWTSTTALDESGLISTTTVSTASDSANVFYSTSGRSNVPYRVVGFVESTQATAGTWATAPSTIQGAGGEALAYLGTARVTVPIPIAVRQSIQYGPTTGTPPVSDLIPASQIGNTLATGVTLKFSASPTLLSVANGFNADGSPNDLNWIPTADITIPNLTGNTVNYIWVDVVAQTAGFVTVADADQAGGVIPITNNQYTFDYIGFKNYLGNGATATQTNRIIVAEVTTNATVIVTVGTVPGIRCRAYKGYYESGLIASAANTATDIYHNVGTKRFSVESELECVTIDNGNAVGQVLPWALTHNGGGVWTPMVSKGSKNASQLLVTASWGATANPATLAVVGVTQASWRARVKIRRDY